MLRPHVVEPGPPGQRGRPLDGGPRLRRLRRQVITRLVPTREHGTGGLPHLVGLDAELLQDRSGHALFVQSEKLMVGADLRGTVGGRLTGGRRKAGHQPGLLFRAALVGAAGQHREALPGGLLGHADPLADLRP